MAAHIALHETGAPFEARPFVVRQQGHAHAGVPGDQSQRQGADPAGRRPRRSPRWRASCSIWRAPIPRLNLLPVGDPEAEAQVVSWMSFIASAIHPARQARGSSTHARSGWSPSKRLGKNEWAVGGRYSIADIHLFRLYWRFRGSLDLKPGEFPNIEAHYDAHDGAAGGQEDDRDRREGRLRPAARRAASGRPLQHPPYLLRRHRHVDVRDAAAPTAHRPRRSSPRAARRRSPPRRSP